ncbi:MAG: hypothetical protein ABI723_14675 [Bacteroidia bacterium]
MPRSLYITPTLFLYCAYAWSQSIETTFGNEKIYNYKLIIEAPVYECNILGSTAEDVLLQVAEPGSVFTLVGNKDDDTVIIRFWLWKENTTLNYALCYADSLCVTRKYFLMSHEDLKCKTIPRYNRNCSFTAGTVLIPVKMRLQHFDFSKDFTLGPTAGAKFRLSHYMHNYMNILAGLGITSVTLDKRSPKGVVEESIEVPALSPSLGCVLEFNRTTQVGLFCGCDYISDNETQNFIYHGKLWLSFGLGFTILSQESNSSVNEERKQ